jgi:hypothetical protein
MIPPSTDWLLTNKCGAKGEADLQGEEAVVDLDLLGEEIGADGGLVLVAELFVHVPAPRRGEGERNQSISPPIERIVASKKEKKWDDGSDEVEREREEAYWFISEVLPTLSQETQTQEEQRRGIRERKKEQKKKKKNRERLTEYREEEEG